MPVYYSLTAQSLAKARQGANIRLQPTPDLNYYQVVFLFSIFLFKGFIHCRDFHLLTIIKESPKVFYKSITF